MVVPVSDGAGYPGPLPSARLVLSAAAALLLAPAAGAAIPAKSGRAFVPPPLPGPRALQALSGSPKLLIQVERRQSRRADVALRAAGGRLVFRSLGIWSVPTRAIAAWLPALEHLGLVRAVERDSVRRLDARRDFTDPLVATEWWRRVVGADAATPPGPGIPLTVIDSGLDVTHPEFATRPNTKTLNEQTTTGGENEAHGTAVSSVAAAPADGEGVVGVYPQAQLQSWDASPTAQSDIDVDSEIAALGAVSNKAGVINMSFGGNDYLFQEEEAILTAFGTGSILVAAAGNEFQSGNPNEYPASFNHVLTIAATDHHNQPTEFSNEHLSVDLAAPGIDIPVAVTTEANPTGFDVWDGTSFSSPIVAAATAWVWTQRPALDNTQVFNLMRFSARDVYDKGYDTSTGFGIVRIPAALHNTAPNRDPQEPNEDVYLVKPNGLFANGSPLLTYPAHLRAGVSATLDVTEDPEDVYRFYLPAGRTFLFTAKGDTNVDLEIWGPLTKTVHERGAAAKRDLLGYSQNAGKTPDVVRVTNSGSKGEFVYGDVYLGKNVDDAAYTLTVRPT